MAGLKYSGLLAVIVGSIILSIFVYFNPPTENIISAWLIWDVLSISQILPLVGLGIALSILSRPFIIISIVVFIVAYFLALENYSRLWIYFANPSDVSQHLYLTLPIASFFSGLLLVSPSFLRKYLVFIVSFIIAAMVAITVKLTDPTLHDPIIPKLGLSVSIWIIISIMMCAKYFYKAWFPIAIRILGSWLLASSLLFGGTALAVKYGKMKPQESSTNAVKKELPQDEELFIPDFN